MFRLGPTSARLATGRLLSIALLIAFGVLVEGEARGECGNYVIVLNEAGVPTMEHRAATPDGFSRSGRPFGDKDDLPSAPPCNGPQCKQGRAPVTPAVPEVFRPIDRPAVMSVGHRCDAADDRLDRFPHPEDDRVPARSGPRLDRPPERR